MSRRGSNPSESGLRSTEDYGLFVMHTHNRPLRQNKALAASMRQYGFRKGGAIHCRPTGNGKLEVVQGHHRLDEARRQGLPVWYIVDDEPEGPAIDVLEGAASRHWSVEDFAECYREAGYQNYVVLQKFRADHHLTMGSAAALVGGQSAGSGNMNQRVKAGTFLVRDMAHARDVVEITDLCRRVGLGFATSGAFVAAVSMVLRIPELDVAVLVSSIERYPMVMNKRSRKDEYLEEVESQYNYRARGDKGLAVAFRAVQVARKRARIGYPASTRAFAQRARRGKAESTSCNRNAG